MMKDLTLFGLARSCGGELSGGAEDFAVSSIVTDSRKACPGCVFAAIKGERADGRDFIGSAAQKGAGACLCEDPPSDCPVPSIKVPAVIPALGAAAAAYRRKFSIPVTAIVGSVGKTTAKEFIWRVLSEKYDTLKTEGNLNNELGVPMTLLALRENHAAAAVELGISHFGEMTRLAQMASPGIAVFTAIGDAHLEFLGDRAGVLKAKSEILEQMDENSLVIANGDDPLLADMKCRQRKILFGTGRNCEVGIADPVFAENETSCRISAGGHTLPVRIPAYGRHLVYAAAAAAAVGLELGVSPRDIVKGISSYEPVGERARVLRTGYLTVISDCYNSNPTSAASAVRSLSALPGRRVCILGDMLELGKDSERLHYELGRTAAESGAEVIACGKLAAHIARGAGGMYFPDAGALIGQLASIIRKGDTVLVKASRSMKFETVCEALSKLK